MPIGASRAILAREVRGAVVLAVVAAALGGATTSAAPEAVPRALVGKWTYDFNVLTIKSNGRVVFKLGSDAVEGTVSGTRTRALFGPVGSCAGKGIYAWKVTGRQLTFRRVTDACLIRRTFLRTTWTRA